MLCSHDANAKETVILVLYPSNIEYDDNRRDSQIRYLMHKMKPRNWTT